MLATRVLGRVQRSAQRLCALVGSTRVRRRLRTGMRRAASCVTVVAFSVVALFGQVSATFALSTQPLAPAAPQSSVASAAATTSANAAAQGTEVVDKRTETATHYRMPDGTMRAVISQTPVRYKEADGSWNPINNALVSGPIPGESRNAAGPLKMSFAAPSTGRSAATMARGTLSVGLDLVGANTSLPLAAGDKVTYLGAARATSLVYQPLAWGLKETLVLQSSAAPSEFTFRLSTTGGSVVKDFTTGGWALADDSGKPVMRIGRLAVWDSAIATQAVKPTSPVATMTVEAAGGGDVLVHYAISPEWLASPKRVYPVYVDPTLSNGPSQWRSLCSDTYNQLYDTPSVLSVGNRYGWIDQIVGGDDENGWIIEPVWSFWWAFRSYVKFDTSAIEGSTVTSATFSIDHYDGGGGTIGVWEVPGNSTWPSAWYGQPNFTTRLAQPTLGNYGSIVASVTSSVVKWAANSNTNKGLMLEQDAGQEVQGFTSSSALLIVSYGSTHTVTPSAGAGGSISPATTQTVGAGQSASFTITPNTGYHISNVTVDGSSVGTPTVYTFSDLTADHTIAATFAVNTYAITASAGSHGSISPSGTQYISHGANATYTITPDASYGVGDVVVDGTSVGSVETYTFASVAATHSIAASFTLTPPPELSDPRPAPGSAVTTLVPEVSIAATSCFPITSVAATLNGSSVPATLSAGRIVVSVPQPISVPTSTVSVKATSVKGSSETSWAFLVSPPVLASPSPSAGETVPVAPGRLSVTIAQAPVGVATATAVIDGEEAATTIGGGHIYATAPVLLDGSHAATITATDAWGHSGSLASTFTVSSTEIKDLREEFSATFATDGTSLERLESGEPVNYQPEDAVGLAPIDPRLDASTQQGVSSWDSRQNSFDVSLPSHLGSGWVSVESSEGTLAFRPMSTPLPGYARSHDATGSTVPMTEDAVRYAGAFDGADIQYVSTPGGLKENLILNSAPASATFSFEVAAQGLQARPELEGSVGFYDSTEATTPAFIIAAPNMYDSAGSVATTDQVRFGQLEVTQAGYRLDIIADPSWLATATYPVTIDPWVLRYYEDKCGASMATYASSANGGTHYYAVPEGGRFPLKAGTSGGAYYESFIYFPIGEHALHAAKLKIAQAELQLNCYSNSGSNNNSTLKVSRLTEPWSDTRLSWWDRPAWDAGTTLHGAAQSGSKTAIDVTDYAQKWVDTEDNHGLMLWQDSDQGLAKFDAWRVPVPANAPILSLKLTSTPVVKLTQPRSDTPVTGTVEMKWDYSDYAMFGESTSTSKPQRLVQIQAGPDPGSPSLALDTTFESSQATFSLPSTTTALVGTGGRMWVRMRASGSTKTGWVDIWSEWTPWTAFTLAAPTGPGSGSGIKGYRATEALPGGAQVDLASGRLQISRSDFTGPGTGNPLSVGAVYDSGNTTNAGLGKGWTLADPIKAETSTGSNTGFETAGTGGQPAAYWTASADWVSRVYAGEGGGWALQINNQSNFTSTTVWSSLASTAAVWPGARVSAEAHVCADNFLVNTNLPASSPKGAAVRVRFTDAAGRLVSEAKSEDFYEQTTTGAWRVISLETTAPATAAFMSMGIDYDNACYKLKVDNATLSAGTTYFADATGSWWVWPQVGEGVWQRDPLSGAQGLTVEQAARNSVEVTSNAPAPVTGVTRKSINGLAHGCVAATDYDAVLTSPDSSDWIRYDLGSVRPISRIDMYLWDGYESSTPRTYTYSIDVSAESSSGPWTEVVPATTARSWQHKTFDMVRARWVRVHPIACSTGDQFHICEFEVPITKLGDEAVDFDSSGRLLSASDPDANITWYRRDDQHRLASVEDTFTAPGGTRTTARGITLHWAGNGDLSSLDWKGIDSSGGTTNEGSVVTYSASAGNPVVVSRTEGAGSVPVASYQYTSNRITRITDADSRSVTISYDSSGRVSTATIPGADATSTVTFAYGTNYTTVTYAGNDDTSQCRRVFFDPNVGNQITTVITDPNGRTLTTSAAYDGYGHVKQTTDAAGVVASCTVDPHGFVTRSSSATATIVTTAKYDEDHLVSTVDSKGTTTTVQYSRPSWRVISSSTQMADSEGDGKVSAKSTYDAWGNKTSGDIGTSTSSNMLDNGTFEASLAGNAHGWDLGTGASAQAPPASSSRYLGNSVVHLAAGGTITSKAEPVTASGSGFAASAWVAGAGTVTVKLYSDSSGSSLAQTASVVFAGSLARLTRVSLETTAPSGVKSAKLEIKAATSSEALVDNCRLEAANTLGRDNLIDNEGFERVSAAARPLDWTPKSGTSASQINSGWGSVSGKWVGKIVTTEKSGTSGDGYYLSNYVPVRAGEVYTVGAWIRTLDVSSKSSGGVQARLLYCASTSDGNPAVTPISDTIKGTTDFEHYIRQVTIPAGVNFIRIDLHVWSCSGTAYFDQVSVEPASLVESTGYDPATHSFAIEATSAAGRRSSNTYDARGRLTSSSYAASSGATPELSVTNTYDAAGRLQKVSIPATDATTAGSLAATFTYSPAGLLKGVKDPAGHITTMDYDTRGQLRNVTDPLGVISESTYDALGRLVSTLYPRTSGSGVRLTGALYDTAGRLTTATIYAADGTTALARSVSAFDNASRVTDVAMSGEETASAHTDFDTIGRAVGWSVTGPIGTASGSAAYDVASLPTTSSWTFGSISDVVTNSYAKTGELLSTRMLGRVWNDSFDVGGGLASVSSTAAALTLSRDEYGRLDTVRSTAYANGAPTSIAFDEIAYDYRDRIASLAATGSAGHYTDSFTYDRADRLKSWQRGAATVNYGYDAAGNLISRGPSGAADTFVYNAGDELTGATISGVSLTYTNDLFGRRTATKSAGTTITAYAWNARGQLAQVVSNATTSTYRYGAGGMRDLKTVTASGVTTSTYTLWSGNHPIAQFVMRGASTTKYRYAYGPGGVPLALEVTSPSGAVSTYAYHTDALGSVVALTDNAGSVVASYTYDPWGRSTGIGGPSPALAASQPLRYRAYYLDLETGLYYMPARYYDAVAARFLSADPVPPKAGDPGSINRYAYCEDDSVGKSDPSGADPPGEGVNKPGPEHDRHIAYLREHSPAWSSWRWANLLLRGGAKTARFFIFTRPAVIPYEWGCMNHVWVGDTKTRWARGMYQTTPDEPDGMDPVPVFLPDGYPSEEEFMRRIENSRAMKEGENAPYWPFDDNPFVKTNYCHSVLSRAFAEAGVPYPGATNGTVDFDERCLWFGPAAPVFYIAGKVMDRW
jgi:RHS repeat-associated protein